MHGRSQLVESFVWLIPFLREKRKKNRENMKEKIKGSGKMKRDRDEKR